MTKINKPIDASEYDGNFVREVTSIYRGNRKERMVELSCTVCNSNFQVSYHNSKRTRQKACSNICGGVLTRKVKDYRADKHPLYSVWLSLRDRCNNPNNNKFHRYGGRGISFSSNFERFNDFLDYVSNLENYPYSETCKLDGNYSIDRINCDVGYIEGNIRWADKNTQAANKTWKKPNSSSRFIGVTYCSTNKAWISKVQFKGKIKSVYYGQSEEDAYLARKKFILDNNLPNAL